MIDTKLNVCEIFSTIQGEGKYAGYPVTFIRLFGTNLPNKTDPYRYASDSGAKEENCKHMTIEEVLQEIGKLQNKNNHWVIAGGEPLIQQKAILNLIKDYEETHQKKPFIEIETNGTISPIEELDSKIDHYNVNILLSNAMDGSSSATFSQRAPEGAITSFAKNTKSDFKFMVDVPEDFKEISEIVQIYKLNKNKIWLCPLAVDKNQIAKKTLLIWNTCLTQGYKLSSKHHVLVFGIKKST